MDISQLKIMKRQRIIDRFIGAIFSLIGCILLGFFLLLPLDENSKINYSGVDASDVEIFDNDTSAVYPEWFELPKQRDKSFDFKQKDGESLPHSHTSFITQSKDMIALIINSVMNIVESPRGDFAIVTHQLESVRGNKLLSREYIGTTERSYSGIVDKYRYWINYNLVEVKLQPSWNCGRKVIEYFRYFSIDDDGKLLKKETNRQFAFTEFVPINKNYFDLHWTNTYLEFSHHESQDIHTVVESNTVVDSHLSTRHLAIMRNEIFASYGYIFKNPEWNKYFRKKEWYKPKHHNVDQYLTDLEKSNIKFIFNYEEKMKNSPNDFSQPKSRFISCAG
jgi:hypothetical protein